MYTIGQVSQMSGIPISTLRYYDREGLFPSLARVGGIRQFSENDLDALRIIECLKQSGLEIRDIRQFMAWCSMGSSTYELRLQLFLKQRAAVEAEISRLEKTLDMIRFKCWYYTQALRDGNEDRVQSMLPDGLPDGIQELYDHGRNR